MFWGEFWGGLLFYCILRCLGRQGAVLAIFVVSGRVLGEFWGVFRGVFGALFGGVFGVFWVCV